MGSQSSLTATTPIANSIGDALLLYAAMANTSYPGTEAPRKLSLPKELLPKQERSAVNADWVLGSEQPLSSMKIGLCRQVRCKVLPQILPCGIDRICTDQEHITG
jgi:hypothetical protein